MLPIIPALVALGQAGYQAYQANKQNQEASQLKDSNYVPGALSEAEQTARLNAGSLPVGYERAMQKNDQQTAQTVETAKRIGGSAGQVQQAAADADARNKELQADLAVNAGAQQRQSQGDLTQLLSEKAKFEKMSHDAYGAAVSALKGASKQNNYNALTGLGSNMLYLYGSQQPGQNGSGSNVQLTQGQVGGGGNQMSDPQLPPVTPQQQGYINSGYDPNQIPAMTPAQMEYMRRFNFNLPQ